MRFKMDFSKLAKCGARARSSGKPCRHIALQNGRCHYHGGKSVIKHGLNTKVAKNLRSTQRRVVQESKELLASLRRLMNG